MLSFGERAKTSNKRTIHEWSQQTISAEWWSGSILLPFFLRSRAGALRSTLRLVVRVRILVDLPRRSVDGVVVGSGGVVEQAAVGVAQPSPRLDGAHSTRRRGGAAGGRGAAPAAAALEGRELARLAAAAALAAALAELQLRAQLVLVRRDEAREAAGPALPRRAAGAVDERGHVARHVVPARRESEQGTNEVPVWRRQHGDCRSNPWPERSAPCAELDDYSNAACRA